MGEMPRTVVAALLALAAGCPGPGANGPRPEPCPPPPAAPATRTCAEGEHESAGHCCAEGADWVPARAECYCFAEGGCETVAEAADPPPPDVPAAGPDDAEDEPPDAVEEARIAPACRPGGLRPAERGGGCCPEGQYFATARGACRALPRCGAGEVAADGRCVAVSAPDAWVAIAPGSFLMGSPPHEANRFDDERQVRVSLTRWYLLRRTEVTQGDFEAALGYNPSRFHECGPSCPVERVSWNEAAAYCDALSEAEGLEPCYRCRGRGAGVTCQPVRGAPQACSGYRLPTEAEWEHAARAGAEAPRYGEPLAAIAWYRGNSLERTWPVGRLLPNRWGLVDMLGNVDEWCHDWYGPYPTEDATDPAGPREGTVRVLRGGSWIINEWRVRAAYRYRGAQTMRVGYVGFRPARTVPPRPAAEG